jgi:hypothetical protein
VTTTTPLITIVCPYYRQPKMLRKQLETWASYPQDVYEAFDFIIVDDCSPEPAKEIVDDYITELVFDKKVRRPARGHLYRIDKDVPWNRGMARNLGTKMATTPWVLHVDTDHVLPAVSAKQLVEYLTPPEGFHGRCAWYRFARLRIGQADETRKKDKIPANVGLGEIHPHIDSYVCRTDSYWKAGGYNEDFSGVLGGGTPFLKEMTRVNGEPVVLNNCYLHVHTRHSVPDSSEHTLPRDPEAFKRRKREIMAKRGTLRGHDPIRLPWHKVF